MILTRFHNLENMEIEVEFLTPTFLGGADKRAEIRSAPFKSLIRQWWRIVNGHLSPAELFKLENDFFGSAGKSGAIASSVKVRVISSSGDITTLNDLNKKDNNIQILKLNGEKQNINAFIYLGYGPVASKDGFANFITPGKKVTLHLEFPKITEEMILNVLHHAHYFGSIGSRSRNGWGAFSFASKNYDFSAPVKIKATSLENSFCEKKYPWTFAKDQNGLLCWETAPFKDWKQVLREMAMVYAKLRYNTQILDNINNRAILGYPLKNARQIKEIDRMPKQLRMTVIKCSEGLKGLFFHLPYMTPVKFNTFNDQNELWKDIHEVLDNNTELRRTARIVTEVR